MARCLLICAAFLLAGFGSGGLTETSASFETSASPETSASLEKSAPPEKCVMDVDDRAWLANAMTNWQRVSSEELKRPDSSLPTIVVLDMVCSYVIDAGDIDGAASTPHDANMVVFPNRQKMPVGPTAFASNDAGGFFAMSLPTIWHANGVTSDLGLERFMDGVMLHEIAHVDQIDLANSEFEAIAKEHRLIDPVWNDDMIQQRFEADPAYIAAWQAETEMLYAAARAPRLIETKALAGKALNMMRERRARWFTGEIDHYGQLDDVFLTMEGVGQWVSYRHFMSAEGGGSSSEEALEAVRRKRKYWSQDQGLALILVVDRLLSDWQRHAYASPDWRAEHLLVAAIGD